MAAAAADLRDWLGRIGNDNAQGEYYLTDAIALAVEQGRAVEGVLVEAPQEVLGINDKLQLAIAERSLQRREAERLMRLGVTLIDPERLDVRGTLEVGSDVCIDVGAIFEGHVRLGDRVRIGAYSVLADTQLGADCTVQPYTVMQQAIVAPGCEIGPFARIRPGSELGAGVKIGNFVEVKNSHVAEASKINHLSYIGDTTIGQRVNVGAGTITCNYDGAAKHRTVIADGAFIGSGTMLVAPVEIGADATIGAGSTITKDAPAAQLTLSRAAQVSVPSWKRPKKPVRSEN
jgi:bifunctional UDP-N-acetylglucosamine pyrophosphorylase / glucosamine-1-phosphate N-acetyltransferase